MNQYASISRRSAVSLLALAGLPAIAAEPVFVSPERWTTYNERQAARAREILSRGPTEAERGAVAPFLRGGICSAAALYTLFPRGHEKPFAQVVRRLYDHKFLMPGGMWMTNILEVLRQLQMPSTQYGRSNLDFDALVQAIDSDRAVFLAGPTRKLIELQLEPGEKLTDPSSLNNSYHVVRLSALRRDTRGALSHVALYDVNRDSVGWVPAQELAGIYSWLPWDPRGYGAIVTNGPVPF